MKQKTEDNWRKPRGETTGKTGGRRKRTIGKGQEVKEENEGGQEEEDQKMNGEKTKEETEEEEREECREGEKIQFQSKETYPPQGRQPSVCSDSTDPQPPKRGFAQP